MNTVKYRHSQDTSPTATWPQPRHRKSWRLQSCKRKLNQFWELENVPDRFYKVFRLRWVMTETLSQVIQQRICDFTSLLLMIIDLHDSYRNTERNKVTDFSLTLLSRWKYPNTHRNQGDRFEVLQVETKPAELHRFGNHTFVAKLLINVE